MTVFDIGCRIMFWDGDISESDGVEYYPLFVAAFIDELDKD